MAFHNTLTPIYGDDKDETTTSFMNMKFGELLENDLELAKQLSILSDDRGYLTTKNMPNNTNFNTLIENGKYKITYASGDGISSPNDAYFGSYSIDVTKNGDGYIYQKATCFWSTGNLLGKTFERYQIVGVWGGWKELVTTTMLQSALDAQNL